MHTNAEQIGFLMRNVPRQCGCTVNTQKRYDSHRHKRARNTSLRAKVTQRCSTVCQSACYSHVSARHAHTSCSWGKSIEKQKPAENTTPIANHVNKILMKRCELIQACIGVRTHTHTHTHTHGREVDYSYGRCALFQSETHTTVML
jgi:hypothetical protein